MRYFFGWLFLGLLACNSPKEEENYDPTIAPPPPAPLLSYQVMAQHPHDTSAYTQGLQWYNGNLFEGTGDYGNSSLRITELNSGKVLQKHLLGDPQLFGEGITILNDKLYQLTWQNNIAYLYDIKNINKPIKTFNWPYEGWGITHNQKELIISDGSANLYFVDTASFRVMRTVAVTESGKGVEELNELEYINGYVYANIYQTADIIKIDPESGQVTGRMSFANLLSADDITPGRTDVLNGIAYDSSSKRIFITGKRWPKLFEVAITP
jgi:glutamine cyclotransferase